MAGNILNPLERMLNRQLLRFACGTAIFCPSCETILDCDDAVSFAVAGRTGIRCGSCFDSQLTDAAQQAGITTDDARTKIVDLVDGRESE
jgi:hypothetical protein